MKTGLIGFVVAMEKEAQHLLKESHITNEHIIAGKRVFIGSIYNRDFVLILSGIGKVNAGMATQLLIDKYNPEIMINFGVAGGKENSGLNAGDIVQVKSACQYDFDLSEIDNVDIGYMQDYDLTYFPVNICNKLPYKSVKCATGDRFTNKQTYLDIIKDLGADIVDMECSAIAQVCYANNIPLHIVKLISDVDGVDESIYQQYTNNVKTICDKIPNAIKDILNSIK